MTKVISFINKKGGTGKTTSAINVATSLREMGFEVALIETDTNRSLLQVRKQELESVEYLGRGVPDIVQSDETDAERQIVNLRREMVSFVIVDGAANMSAYAIRRISLNSDIVVVPTGLSRQEILVAERTLADVLPACETHTKLKVVLLPNRIHFLTAPSTINKILEHLRVPVMEMYIPYFKQFHHISTLKPADGYMEITNYLLKLLEMEPVLF
ncbi:MAG: hypothetical protein KatS3mg031_0472 [Chitinophagales bacterium]|nr:MAG: hypothetical protein KatS3mg031_0472 [Chitinophagales bacterium]